MAGFTVVFNEEAKFKAENKVIIERFKTLNRILFDSKNCYELWWAYLRAKSKKEHFIFFLKYKDFFETMGYSCITSLIINLFKLYDESPESYSILHLIKDSNRGGLLNKLDNKCISKNKKQAIIIWKKVKKLRHKLFAHKNRDLTVKEVYALAKVTPNNLRDLTKYTLEILNYIAPRLHESRKKLHRAVRKDSLNLLRILINKK